ncbi:hypothetical protein GCM10025771_00160 [Niveibacterium umoris]|uniref:Uncharacterized protein n=1 Tax=Niveibacterium umoris TaxID=1193620 RepID=A0A840BQM4_9RHOO|nr:hypothetical protein [Niveibacterium umoris]MBB4014923.1 hypothetical protein [Niveibacterium umoris]
MPSFKEAFEKIADGLEDLSSLEVVTYRGTIKIEATDVTALSFDKILQNAKAQAGFRVVASTKSRLDGDTRAFYDDNATASDIAAHNALWDSASAKRAAVVQIFESEILKRIA